MLSCSRISLNVLITVKTSQLMNHLEDTKGTKAFLFPFLWCLFHLKCSSKSLIHDYGNDCIFHLSVCNGDLYFKPHDEG